MVSPRHGQAKWSSRYLSFSHTLSLLMTGQRLIPFTVCAHWLFVSRRFVVNTKRRLGSWSGSTNAHSGDLSGKLVYAMLVDDVLPIEEYDRRARADWPHRIPNVDSPDLSERLGDCIYDFSSGVPVQRRGVHGPRMLPLISAARMFSCRVNSIILGSHAYCLPDDLLAVCRQTQGHKSNANAPYFQRFVTWLRGLHLTPGQLYGWPDFIIDWAAVPSCGGMHHSQA